MSQKIIQLLSILLFILYGFLAVANFLSTTYISTTQNDYREAPYQTFDNPVLTLIFLFVIFIFLYFIDRFFKFENIKTNTLRIVASLFVCVVGFLWVFAAKTYPVHDQSIVSGAASAFMNKDFSRLNPGEYLFMYPHQLGIVFIFQCIYSFVGQDNTTFIMLLNVILLCGIYNFLFKTLKLYTHSIKIYNIYWFMTFFSFAPVFYCTFVYGTIIGLFFSVAAIYFLASFFDNKDPAFFAISFLMFAMACIAKSNYKIFVIAAVIIFIFKAIQYRKVLFIPLAGIMSLTLFAPSLITAYYSSVSGITIDRGAPSTLWVAMGLQEGPCGNGWYNQYNVITYAQADGNPAEASAIARKDISNSLLEFGKHPSYGLQFFMDKTLSQWNDPSFQSLWLSDYWDNHTDSLSAVTESIYHGLLNKFFLKLMDMVALFLWFGNAIFYFVKRKSLRIEQLLLGIIFLGGFIFHFFWEAKALYTMPYFVLSMIGGTWGISILSDYFNKTLDNILTIKKSK